MNTFEKSQTEVNNIPRYWDTVTASKKVLKYIQQQEGNVNP